MATEGEATAPRISHFAFGHVLSSLLRCVKFLQGGGVENIFRVQDSNLPGTTVIKTLSYFRFVSILPLGQNRKGDEI